MAMTTMVGRRRAPGAGVYALACGLVLLPGLAQLRAEPVQFEREQDMPSRLLLGREIPLSGPGYRVPATTPVRDFMGRFRIETDLGTLEAVGSEELAERLAELPAVQRLDALERSDVFGRALAASARATGEAVARVITQPVETLAALPAGIGRVLVAAGLRVRNVAVSVGDASQRAKMAEASDERASPSEPDASESVIDFAKESGKVNAARRAIAKDLGIDPYTRNPLVAGRLKELAWASVAGGISLDIALAAVPRFARHTLATAGRIDELAWELPPVDIRRQLERRLRDRGHDGFEVREFLRNGALSPSDQLRFVEALERIDASEGEQEVIALGGRVPGPRHARFMLRQLDLLVAENHRNPLRVLSAEGGLVWGASAKGAVLPLPVDRFAWTEAMAKVFDQPASRRSVRGRILLTGTATPLARSRLSAMGWMLTVVD